MLRSLALALIPIVSLSAQGVVSGRRPTRLVIRNAMVIEGNGTPAAGPKDIVIENALKYRQAESSATTDYLTGLPNARSLFLHLDAELARSKRNNTQVVVLVCDLDGFKQVNDRHGHLEGNKVLQSVAQGLSEGCREYDYVARMGGDEFVLILPGLEEASVQAKALQLREMAETRGSRICGENIVSLSVGEAFYPRDGLDAEQLLAEADRRMYKAKQEARPSNLQAD